MRYTGATHNQFPTRSRRWSIIEQLRRVIGTYFRNPTVRLVVTICAGTLGVLACEKVPVSADTATQQCSAFDPSDEVTLHITYPAGSETFEVGDRVEIGFCYEDTTQAFGGEELLLETSSGVRLEIAVFWDGADESVRANALPGKFLWTIPDTLHGTNEQGDKVPMSVLSDSCRIRFQGYGEGSDVNFDNSGWFSIK